MEVMPNGWLIALKIALGLVNFLKLSTFPFWISNQPSSVLTARQVTPNNTVPINDLASP